MSAPDTAAARIAAFAAATFADGVPGHVLDAAHLHLLDAVGVGLASASLPETAGWARAATAGTASALTGATAEAGAAAMINGALIHALEFDDTHIASVVHGSAVAAPVALAAAQLAGASGRDMVLGYVVAWEVAIRIGLAAPGAFQARGFQATSVGGAIAAAAAAARIMGLERTQAISAIGIAGGQASGSLAFLADGATSKALNPGWAARTGIEAARLAAAGMTGPASVLESGFGVMTGLAGDAAGLDPALATLGEAWLLPDAAFKLYPCCHYIHPFLEAVEQAMADGLRADDLVTLTALVPPPAAPLVCEPWTRRQAPISGYDGKWGLAYAMALMLVDGQVDVDSFAAPPRPEVLAVARRMTWAPMQDHGFPRRFAARIAGQGAAGPFDVAIDQVRGAPDRPVDAAVIREKFTRNAKRRFDAAHVARLEAVLLGLSAAPDTRSLAALL